MRCELAAQSARAGHGGLPLVEKGLRLQRQARVCPVFPEVEERADTKNFSRDLGGAPIGAWKEARPGDNIA